MKKIILLGLLGFVFLSCQRNNSLLTDKEEELKPMILEDLSEGRTSIPIAVRQRGIWLIGGRDNANLISAVDLYDPQTDTWYANATQLPTPRAYSGVAIADGKIYVIGGIDSTGEPTTTVEIFDIASHTWSTGTPYPFRVQGLEAVSIGKKIYAIGGSSFFTAEGATSKILRYNNIYNYWLVLYDIAGSVTTFRTDFGVAVLDGVTFVIGGRDNGGNYQNTNQWHYLVDNVGTATGTAMLQQRFALSACAYSSARRKYILVTGGYYTTPIIAQPFTGSATNTFYYYIAPLNTQSVTTGTSMGSARAYHSSICWGIRCYVFGGTNNGIVSSTFEYILDVETPANLTTVTWNTGTMPRARYGFKVVSMYQN